MHRAAGVTLPVDARLGGAEQPLHLAELGVGLLQFGGFAGEHVEAVVVAHGHLVGEPAEIPGSAATRSASSWRRRRSSASEPPAATRPPTGTTAPLTGRVPSSCVASVGDTCPFERRHQPPVSIGWAPSLLISSSCFWPSCCRAFCSLVEFTLTAFGQRFLFDRLRFLHFLGFGFRAFLRRGARGRFRGRARRGRARARRRPRGGERRGGGSARVPRPSAPAGWGLCSG